MDSEQNLDGNKKGKIVVFCAPSGGGKSTLINRLKKDFPQFEESISCTTRQVRGQEQDGVDYFFITEEEFKNRIDNGGFLEWAEVHKNFYGTSRSFVEERLNKGAALLFDIDVQGADAIKEYFGDKSFIIFISPPSMEVLEERLRGRDTDSEDAIKTRLEMAQKELKRKDDYDACLINDDLEVCYSELKELVGKVLKG